MTQGGGCKIFKQVTETCSDLSIEASYTGFLAVSMPVTGPLHPLREPSSKFYLQTQRYVGTMTSGLSKSHHLDAGVSGQWSCHYKCVNKGKEARVCRLA